MTTVQDKQQVESVIQDWRSGFAAKDIARVKSLWDQSYSQLLYIAEENNDHLSGWAAIDEYYNAIPGMVGDMNWAIDNLTVDVSGDMAYAYLTFHVEANVPSMNRTLVANGRNTFVLRRTGGQWKIIHYHESLSRDRSHEMWGFLWE